jgi:hypothetical protein
MMDQKKVGASTPPAETAMSLYQEAMLLFSQGADHEDVIVLLGMAQACALVSIAYNQGRFSS